MSEQNNIKQSLKFSSLFGGVQFFTIFITIIRSKIVAVLIGPMGYGIMELFTTTTNLISSLTSFSLGTSAVRDISIAHQSKNQKELNTISSIFSNLVWFTGLLGSLICLIGSPLWSKITFGNYDYTFEFAILSIIFILGQLSSSKNALLQGTRHFKYMAYASIIGNIVGFITTIPLYYFWGIKGIVPVIILSAVSSFIIASFYSSKINIARIKVSLRETITQGKGMFTQGLLLTLNGLFTSLLFFILRWFINNRGGIVEVGLYAAGSVVVTKYISLLTQALGQEYYPRLSALSTNNKDFNNAINDQIYIVLLLATPLVCLFLGSSHEILQILYSDRFTSASTFMTLLMFGVIFQLPSWAMGFAFLAKHDNKAFLFYETNIRIIRIILDITCFSLWGLAGLGISFIIVYIVYTLQCIIVCKKKYGFILDIRNIKTYLFSTSVCAVILVSYFLLPYTITLCIAILCFVITGIYTYKKVNHVVGLSNLLRKKIFRNKNAQ